MKFKSVFNRGGRVKVPQVEGSRVKQEFKKEVNINTIIAKMKRGIMPPPWMTSSTPRYGDFTGMPQTLMEAYDLVQSAEKAFESLPLEFRRAIDHDPRNLDKAPRELYEKFGLLKKPEVSDSGSAASDPKVGQRGKGDSDLPKKSPSGSNKVNPKDSRNNVDSEE